MERTVQQIDRWLSEPENSQLEFKEAKEGFDSRKLGKYCVAIANEGGGHLVLGINNAKPRKVVGCNAFQKLRKTVAKLHQKVPFRVNVEEVQHPDGPVVVFDIPSRPKGTAYAYDGMYLMRVGEEQKPMSEDQLRRIFSEGQPGWLEQPAMENVSAQEVAQLLDTQAFFDLLKLPYPSDRSEVMAKLKTERLLVGKSTGFTIPNLTAITLAKKLWDFENVCFKAPRVIVYNGNDKLSTKIDI